MNILRGILGNTNGSEAGRRQEDTVNGYLVDFLGGQMLKIKTLTVDSCSFVESLSEGFNSGPFLPPPAKSKEFTCILIAFVCKGVCAPHVCLVPEEARVLGPAEVSCCWS